MRPRRHRRGHLALERGLIVPRTRARAGARLARRPDSGLRPAEPSRRPHPRHERQLPQRALVRAARRRARCDSGRARCRPTSPSAAPSTPSSTARPRASRSHPSARRSAPRGHGDQARARVEADESCIPTSRGCTGSTARSSPALPTSADADLRNVTIFADAEVDRSPCGTGTCAVMAVLDGMGLLAPEQTFTHESIIGTRFRGRVEREILVGSLPAIAPQLAGEAFMTGSHTFVIDGQDPFGTAFGCEADSVRPKFDNLRGAAPRLEYLERSLLSPRSHDW